MRDILSKLDKILNESALNSKNPKDDYEAKKKALNDLDRDGKTDKSAIQQRRSDLEKEAERKGVKEETTLQDVKKHPESDDPIIAKAISDKEKAEKNNSWMKDPSDPESKVPAVVRKEKQAGKDANKKSIDDLNKQSGAQVWRSPRESVEEGLFQIGDEFGISFSEDHEIATTIVDILEDGIVIELDDTAMSMLTNEGLTFLEGELVEGVAGPQKCWRGYRKVGTKPGTGKNAGKRVNDCEKIGEYFQFDFPEKKDRGPRDSGHDELDRRQKSFKKHELAKDGRDYKDAMSPKSKSPLKGKFNIAGPKGKLPEDAVAEGSAHGYNVARYYAKYQDQRTITSWLRKNAGLDKTAPVYFDDADLVYGDKTIVPNALVDSKYKMSDLLAAVKQAASSETEGIEEARKAATNFTPDDIARLQTINDLETMKAQALELIAKPSERPMKPEKVQWFKGALERIQNKNAVIKLMYDLLLSGEGHRVIGSKGSMAPSSYRQRFTDDIDADIDEAEYQGRKVTLGKPMAGDVKKSKVYVKNPQGNVVKVNFGDKKMRIKKSNPNRRKSFRARHNCDNPGPRHKARYWSCRAW